MPYENEKYFNKEYESILANKINQLEVGNQYEKTNNNWEDVIIYLLSKIFVKFNYYYLRYLKFAP